ncbi:MAG: TIM barrel protein, partial [Massilia sp.]
RPDVTFERARETYLANLRFAAEACKAHGVKVLIEPLNRFDVPGYFLTSNAQALEVIADAGSDKLFLQFDLYHTQRTHGELANTLRACLPHIAHIQIADNPGRHQPGTGEINFPFLLKLIDTLGYQGWVGCEYTALGDITAAFAWRDALT